MTCPTCTTPMTPNYTLLPESLREGTRLYIEHGIPLGSFLRAVASNDLSAAALAADPENAQQLANIARWWIDQAPGNCCGSASAVREWVRIRRGVEGME